MEQKTVIPVE